MPPLASTTCTYKVYIDIKPEMISVVNIRFLNGHTLAPLKPGECQTRGGKAMELWKASWDLGLGLQDKLYQPVLGIEVVKHRADPGPIAAFAESVER
jgi:hypothetical protein